MASPVVESAPCTVGASGPLVELLAAAAVGSSGAAEADPGTLQCATEEDEELAELMGHGLSEEDAREVMAQARRAEEEASEDSDQSSPEVDGDSLLDTVHRWMAEHEHADVTVDALNDFNLKVRFQGHEETTSIDHLGAMLQSLTTRAVLELDLSVLKQPASIKEKVEVTMSRWSALVDALYKNCKADSAAAPDTVVTSVIRGVAGRRDNVPKPSRDSVVVGILLALREQIDAMDDDDLAAACQRCGGQSKAMMGFIEFIQAEESSSDDS